MEQMILSMMDGKKSFGRKELEQGWEYTEQQWEGIQLALENQVCVITGGAGTGKSSIVAGMLAVLKDYQFAQCALAGRAAARLSEITHQEGYTIHRLLGYNPNAKNGKVFTYDEETPLTQNIIILDEIQWLMVSYSSNCLEQFQQEQSLSCLVM